MNPDTPFRNPSLFLALGGVGVGLLLVIVAGGRILASPSSTPAVTPLPTGEREAMEALGSPVRERLDPSVLAYAARQAPFDPGRVAPAERYQLPSERVAPPVEAPPPPPPPEEPPPPAFRLLGVVATTGEVDPLVILQVGDDAPRVLSVGDRVEGYEVAQVAGMSAMLSSGSRNFRVTVAEPSPGGGSAVAAAPAGGRGAQASDRAVQELRNQALRDVARQLQEQVGGQGGRVQIQGDRVVVTMPDGRTLTFGAGGQVQRSETIRFRQAPPGARPGGTPPGGAPPGGARPGGGGDR